MQPFAHPIEWHNVLCPPPPKVTILSMASVRLINFLLIFSFFEINIFKMDKIDYVMERLWFVVKATFYAHFLMLRPQMSAINKIYSTSQKSLHTDYTQLQGNATWFTAIYRQKVTIRRYRNCANCCSQCSVLSTVAHKQLNTSENKYS
jgi:hypothetical protein